MFITYDPTELPRLHYVKLHHKCIIRQTIETPKCLSLQFNFKPNFFAITAIRKNTKPNNEKIEHLLVSFCRGSQRYGTLNWVFHKIQRTGPGIVLVHQLNLFSPFFVGVMKDNRAYFCEALLGPILTGFWLFIAEHISTKAKLRFTQRSGGLLQSQNKCLLYVLLTVQSWEKQILGILIISSLLIKK